MKTHEINVSIREATRTYLRSVATARSEKTHETYTFALQAFESTLRRRKLDLEQTPATDLPEDAVTWFAADLKKLSPATERVYLQACAGLYEFLAAEGLANPNLPRVRLLMRQRGRRVGQRLPQFPKDSIDKVLDYAEGLAGEGSKDKNEQLRNLRDRAFLLTLADTGLRVHEACGLRRGDVDWEEQRAVIIGKGDKQAVIRFSRRSVRALRDYLAARQVLDGKAGKSLTALPLFARHDKGAGGKVKAMTTATGRNIVAQRVEESLGQDAAGTITPHSFRHYFVTRVLMGSGGNLKLAQELARHANIAVTQRYAHLNDDELDQGYHEVFEE